MAQQLKRLGVTRVRPLAGGFHGWRELGYPLQEFYVELAAYIVRKYLARRRFQRELWMARISPEDLKAKLDAGEPLAIVDLRHPLDFLPYPQVLPGAIRLAPSEIEQRNAEIPRDREVILYCT